MNIQIIDKYIIKIDEYHYPDNIYIIIKVDEYLDNIYIYN